MLSPVSFANSSAYLCASLFLMFRPMHPPCYLFYVALLPSIERPMNAESPRRGAAVPVAGIGSCWRPTSKKGTSAKRSKLGEPGVDIRHHRLEQDAACDAAHADVVPRQSKCERPAHGLAATGHEDFRDTGIGHDDPYSIATTDIIIERPETSDADDASRALLPNRHTGTTIEMASQAVKPPLRAFFFAHA